MKTPVSSKLFLVLNFVAMINTSDQVVESKRRELEVNQEIDRVTAWIMPYFTADSSTCTKMGQRSRFPIFDSPREEYPIWQLSNNIEISRCSSSQRDPRVDPKDLEIRDEIFAFHISYDRTHCQLTFDKLGWGKPDERYFVDTPIKSLVKLLADRSTRTTIENCIIDGYFWTVYKKYQFDQAISTAQANELIKQRQANEQARQLEQARELERQQQDELLKRNHVEVILTTNSCWC